MLAAASACSGGRGTSGPYAARPASDAVPAPPAPNAPNATTSAGAAHAVAPLAAHGIHWSPRGDLVAALELTTCGPATGPEPCREREDLVVVDAASGRRVATRAATRIFGFRADGEWLVVAAPGGGVEEWSARTHATRASAFAAIAADAAALCLAPDDRHALVVDRDGGLTLRARDAAGDDDGRALDGVADEAPTDCAFAADGTKVALAYGRGVVVHLLGDDPAHARYRTFPFAGASHLAWSTDGQALVGAGARPPAELGDSPERLVVRWRLDGDVVHAVRGASPAALVRGAIVAHDGCTWQRAAPGASLRRVGPPNPEGSCARDTTTDVVASPDGRRVAATTGRYGARTLVVAPAP